MIRYNCKWLKYYASNRSTVESSQRYFIIKLFFKSIYRLFNRNDKHLIMSTKKHLDGTSNCTPVTRDQGHLRISSENLEGSSNCTIPNSTYSTIQKQ